MIRRAAAFLLSSILLLARPVAEDTPFQTLIGADTVDPGAFAEWSDGRERSIEIKDGAAKVLWTRTTESDWGGVPFGATKTPGIRHLRLGFKTPVPAGSVLVRGGGTLSVLKPDAAYPGDLSDDSQWLPAERPSSGGAVTRDEVVEDEYATWVLPPGTRTRALRFTHEAAASDPKYEGRLGGAMVLAERMINVAPQAIAVASTRQEIAGRINNSTNDRMWQTWNNGEKGGSVVVSPEHPEWVMLVWPEAIPLRGLAACWAGFTTADAQVYAGPADRHPREARDADWKTVVSNSKVEDRYPRELAPNWFSFPETITTRAVRMRITEPSHSGHDHLKNKIRGGRGVWLGELQAMRMLGDAPLDSALPLVAKNEGDHPPIPVKFTLPEPGIVTLVIENSDGQRVRNLVADVPFPAGENTAWWDGTDDLGRDVNAARHGLYQIPQQFVPPGSYKVRGLWKKPIDLSYEFSIYSAGKPAWETADKTGGWMTNHTPPTSALFVPAEKSPDGAARIYLGAYVSEGGHGLQWVRPDGEKIGGQGWVGGTWTGAPTLAGDHGPDAADDVICYVGSVWEGELRITAKTKGDDKPVLKEMLGEDKFEHDQSSHEGVPVLDGFDGGQRRFVLAGLAARDGLLVASMIRQNELLFIDAKAGRLLGRAKVENPRGLAFDASGRLLVLSGKTLQRFTIHGLPNSPNLDAGESMIQAGLDDPHGLTVDDEDRIYISDHGTSHQVKIFTPAGKPVGAIGKPGAPKAGPYDELHMNHPNGLAVTSDGQLWVTEDDYQPKRVSVWTRDGKLLRAFYGPGEYGGGGVLDPKDKGRFYYRGMEFALDWKNGSDRLTSVLYRPSADGPDGQSESHSNGTPEQPIYDRNGARYFTNCFDSNPTGGSSIATLWIDRDGVAVRCASVGRASDWSLLKRDEFKKVWPEGIDTKGEYLKSPAIFAWSDANGDGKPQPGEVAMRKGTVGGVLVQPDLSITVSRLDDVAVRYSPKRFPGGRVGYDLDAAEKLFDGAQSPTSSGGDQVMTTKDGLTISTVAMKPFAPESLGGTRQGQPSWSYPNLWPGLHASHEAPVPDRPGQIIGTTRLLGHFVTPGGGSDAGSIFAVNGNMGNMYLFTADGLFVAELFKDVRVGRSWSMPVAERGMKLNDISLHDENFWPSITQTPDGSVYVVDGGRSSLVRVDGLETIRRIPPSELNVTAEDLKKSDAWLVAREAARRAAQGSAVLRVAIRKGAAPIVDGNFDDWNGAAWADIDKRGTKANFNSNSKPYDVTGTVAIAGDRLFAAFRTGDKELLKNSGETPTALFKNGGCLDLMIGADSDADPKRTNPVAGDCRLIVTTIGNQPRAMLYRSVVPGTKEPVAFSSPWRSVSIDRVDDVTGDLKFAADKDGNYEISIPLAALGLEKIRAGTTLRGDLGILRGNGFQTLQRVYWSNKATAIVSDVPSEAQLTPALWGKWELVPGE